MQAEQEFCLRWNDHKSTLITIFESLLESNTLVDCTLAAEGQCLKAHKVVLSACSPYFQFLLTQHTDKHPIVILKDVKFEELRAMIDYMYRGEVNIPEDQLGPLLKAAESLQIRGLGGASVRDSRGSVDKPTPVPHSNREKRLHSPSRETGSPSSKGTNGALRNVQNVARKGSLSPVPRKRSCPNRASNVDDTKSNECHQNQGSSLTDITSVPSVSSSSNQTSVSSRSAVWSEKDSDRLPSNEKDVPPLAPLSSFCRTLEETSGNTNWCELGLKTSPLPEENVSGGLMPETQNDDPISEMLLVPKTEYVEIDDESLTNAMLDEVQDMETSGPPPIDGGPGTSGFVPWLRNIEGMSDSIATPEAMGTYRASHACETLNTVPGERQGTQTRRYLRNRMYRNSSPASREYRRLRALRRIKKDAMTEEEIEELRRYERERKRAQRARKAAKVDADQPTIGTPLWTEPTNWL